MRGSVSLADELGRGKNIAESRSLHPSLPYLYKDINSKRTIIQDFWQEAHSSLDMSIGIGYGNEIMVGNFSARPYHFLCPIVLC